jgi:hypothetical protein
MITMTKIEPSDCADPVQAVGPMPHKCWISVAMRRVELTGGEIA